MSEVYSSDLGCLGFYPEPKVEKKRSTEMPHTVDEILTMVGTEHPMVCYDCAYSHKPYNVRFCMRFPPEPVSFPAYGGASTYSSYRIVSDLQWCCEFKRKGSM